jgi:hypothetical protein
MTPLLTATGGFLLAVLWFDLMFDVQARGRSKGRDLDEKSLSSIAGYYSRVTTEAYPMSHLVAAVMLVTIGGTVWQVISGSIPPAVGLLAFASSTAPIALAAARVVPNARRLGARGGTLEEQSDLARAILRDHMVCFGSVTVFLAIELLA